MARRLLGLLVIVLGFATAAGCSGDIDLSQALAVTDVLSGYYDNGVKGGANHLVPSITFRLKNQSAQDVSSVELDVAFWPEGRDAELDSVSIRGIGGDALAPGASTEPLTVRSRLGFTLEGAREDFFNHSLFKDVTARVFAKRSGRIIPLGQFKLDRRIIPHSQSSPRP